MAFESLPGVKIVSHAAEQTFIVGDFFSVYFKGNDVPSIYRWSEVKALSENKFEFVITVKDAVYRIPKHCIIDNKKLLNLRGVFEGAVSVFPSIEYNHLKRILPPKYLYVSGDVKSSPYITNGVYMEREINFSNAVLINTRLGKVFQIVAFFVAIASFIFWHLIYGNTSENWFYFLPMSLFTAGIAVMFVYLLCSVLANFHYHFLFKADPAVSEEITFTVSEYGFSAVESFLFTGGEFIPWGHVNYFIETNLVYIVYKNNKAVFWLPKRLFPKETQTELSKFIADRLNQK